MKTIPLVVCIGLLAGCANTTTTIFRRDAKTGEIIVESPKDITITGLDAQLPDGTKIKLKKYTSRARPDSTKAQGERESGVVGKTVEGVTSGAVKGIVPIP